MARRRFKEAPSASTYSAVKAAALLPGQPDDTWTRLRPELVEALHKRKDWYGLIDIHLSEDEVAEALQALESSKKQGRKRDGTWEYSWSVVPEQFELRVAAAAEKAFPDEAIRIYQLIAEQRIGFRERVNYQAAATYLVRVMNLYEQTGRSEAWQTYIGDLRLQNKSLRALREELDSLGLA
jgi:uncharacterized Zn finger protein